MKAAPTFTMVVRLVAVDDAAGERLLGEYTFNHTRTLPVKAPGSDGRLAVVRRSSRCTTTGPR
jgi:hypothetical protein